MTFYVNPTNWYWSVQDSSPGSQVWQGATGQFVALANADYVAFLAAGNTASVIDTATNLYEVIDAFNTTIPHLGYSTFSITGSDKVLSSPTNSPLPEVLNVSINSGSLNLIMPQQNLFGSPALGNPITVLNSDLATTLPVCFSGTTTPIVSIPPLGAALLIPIANDTGAGTWDSFFLSKTITLVPPIPVVNGGTGAQTLSAHGVLLGEGTSALGAATIGTSGRLLIDQGAGVDPAFNAMSGDATITNAGAITVAKIGGVTQGQPNFSAHLGTNQTGIANQTWTKVLVDTVDFDTGSYWDATNHRWTPGVAGTYMVIGNVDLSATAGGASSYFLAGIAKNGTRIVVGGSNFGGGFLDEALTPISCLVAMNGSTDYLELQGFLTATITGTFGAGAASTFFQAFRVGP